MDNIVNITMDTKTSIDYASTSFKDGIINDSPGALLDMLAAVASRQLHSEKPCHKKTCKTTNSNNPIKRKTQESSFNLSQLSSMSASQLVKHFTIFTSDELKKQYSYTCALKNDCRQKYSSFASEGRARIMIKAHLIEHIEFLKKDPQAYNTFTATAGTFTKLRLNLHNKKCKLQQFIKPQETLNKENKDTEKSTNRLRELLTKQSKKREDEGSRIDLKVLGDHSYFEQIKNDVSSEKEMKSMEPNDSDNHLIQENIVLMVIGADSVQTKEYPHDQHSLEDSTPYSTKSECDLLYLSETPWSEEDDTNRNIENNTISTKPKGKAKFIGTSKEEKEMALAFMDRIKKKGNPTANNLQCHICDPPRSFTAPTTLVSHYRSHAGIKPYECRICRSVFTRRHSLKYHMLIHQNQTRFTCTDCGKKFRHPSHFREHRRRHTGEAPFGCEDCGQRFKTRNTYKRHLKTRHGKVLTTTGELLYLSEEDFQKVRTNRKKKIDTADEDTIASESIMQEHFNDSISQEECLIQFIQEDSNYLDNYEDSFKSKTDDKYLETEITVNDSEFVGDEIENRIEDFIHVTYTDNFTVLQREDKGEIFHSENIAHDNKGTINCNNNLNNDILNKNCHQEENIVDVKPRAILFLDGEALNCGMLKINQNSIRLMNNSDEYEK